MDTLLFYKEHLEALAALAAVVLFVSLVIRKAWHFLFPDASIGIPREYRVIVMEIVILALLALVIVLMVRSRTDQWSALDTGAIMAAAAIVARILETARRRNFGLNLSFSG